MLDADAEHKEIGLKVACIAHRLGDQRQTWVLERNVCSQWPMPTSEKDLSIMFRIVCSNNVVNTERGHMTLIGDTLIEKERVSVVREGCYYSAHKCERL